MSLDGIGSTCISISRELQYHHVKVMICATRVSSHTVT
jgi:hypothetical protein